MEGRKGGIPAAGLIGVAGVLAAPLGLLIAKCVSNELLLVVFALVMAYVAFCMFRQTISKGPTEEAARTSVSVSLCIAAFLLGDGFHHVPGS
ncbi:MAG TPA: hypothetical protein VL380_02005 [Nitrosospira sp.]|nr:hypothetical protein [Nitrosospira sp.]